jgi:RecA-family ATPase
VLTIKQAARRHLDAPQLLPDLFPSLKAAGIRFRRAQVTMIAGQPNSGKSLLALFYAIKAERPTLYVSADTDAYTTTLRAAAIVTNNTIDTIEDSFKQENGIKVYQNALTSLTNLEFSFDPSPTLDDIQLMIQAYGEKYGQYPELIIIDNLMNVAALHDNEWTGMRDIMKAAHHMARETSAAVFVLHHTSENEGEPTKPPARKAIQGKVSQLPEVIITVAMEPENSEFRIACVKNRFAKHSAMGTDYVTLYSDAARMKLFESPLRQHVQTHWRIDNVSAE